MRTLIDAALSSSFSFIRLKTKLVKRFVPTGLPTTKTLNLPQHATFLTEIRAFLRPLVSEDDEGEIALACVQHQKSPSYYSKVTFHNEQRRVRVGLEVGTFWTWADGRGSSRVAQVLAIFLLPFQGRDEVFFSVRWLKSDRTPSFRALVPGATVMTWDGEPPPFPHVLL